MKAKSAPALILLILGLAAACASPRPVEVPAQGSEISIVPKPVSVVRQSGSFLITSASRIAMPAGDLPAESVGRYLAERLRTAFGLDVPVTAGPPVEAQGLIMIRRAGNKDLGAGGLCPLGDARRRSPSTRRKPAGLFYGVQTLLQLLPPDGTIGSGRERDGPARSCLACEVEDKPRFPWRGMLLDVSRHFFPKEFIKRFLDLIWPCTR